MKFLIALLLVCCVDLPGNAHAMNDKHTHVLVSAGLSIGGYAALRQMDYTTGEAAALSALAVILVGAGKEYVLDAKADTGDMVANAAGIYSGLMLPLVFRF